MFDEKFVKTLSTAENIIYNKGYLDALDWAEKNLINKKGDKE